MDVSASASAWLAQLAAMRASIAELDLPRANSDDEAVSNVEIVSDSDVSESASASAADIWDLISQDGDTSMSEPDESPEDASAAAPIPLIHDLAWLEHACRPLAATAPASDDTDDGSALARRIAAVLASDLGSEELQTALVDVVGFDALDLVIDLLQHRDEIVAASAAAEVDQACAGDHSRNNSPRILSRAEREEALRRQDYAHKHAELAPAATRGEPHYPHVYKASGAGSGNALAANGRRYGLPVGSEHIEQPRYTEFRIPPTRTGSVAVDQKLVPVADMDVLCRRTFPGYKTLNRMQSLLYPVAYHTNENMLICAPTGAGKTDAAMLTVLNAIARHTVPCPLTDPAEAEVSDLAVQTGDFKIVYVAPMKALAAEITEKFTRRLSWLGITAREFTGDMQLSKREIVETQIIVTTPEKWDVVTRKSIGDAELVQKVRLLIIDEVHMLHDERGAVIESLVARTQRQVESTQSLIRIIGLSATLPNYVDVADFLKVNRMAGLFYFDGSFRPVPLEQHFIGIKDFKEEKSLKKAREALANGEQDSVNQIKDNNAGSRKGRDSAKKARENLDVVAFEKVREMLELGHQIMVFVHSRKDTVVTAKVLYEMAVNEGCAERLFTPLDHPGYDQAVRDVRSSRGRELRELVPKGMGVHHAGMARTDRNLVERLFADGAIKVLCCTATLAWGVNLPAAAVLIKGTQLYSAQEGRFVDLGILDVLQIFGRAGRPQFQDTGISFILTPHKKLHHYLSAVTSQEAIESRFSRKLVDNLNAEISLGTVTSVADAVQWLGYSYLFVRMRRNPAAYAIDWTELRDDPFLVMRRRKLIVDAARVLAASQMIIYNERTDELRAKDVGRIASQFYVLQSSIEVFNAHMHPRATEADVLRMISMSGEFDNIQARDNEIKELDRLREEGTAADIAGGVNSPHAKTNILLQAYISNCRVDDFALVSDTNYVAQNSARVCRALFMIALNRGWGHVCLVLLSLCKSIDKRVWPFQHPFHQFEHLPPSVLRNLDEKFPASSIESLHDMDAPAIGQLVHNQRIGGTLARLLDNFPTVTAEAAEIAPLNRHVLRIRLRLYPDFRWNDRHHGASESYWVWVENSDTSEICHYEYFILSRKKLPEDHELNFTIPLADPIPAQIYVRVVSDRWLGAETVTPVSFRHLIRPDTESVYTDLLDLQPLPVTALKSPELEQIYGEKFSFFNPMQTQIFHTLYHTPANVLLGSPTGSGKTIAAELAMWWALRERPGCKVVYIAPMKALVRERVADWRRRLARPLGLSLVELTGDNTPDTRSIRHADIIITTPEKWDGISRSWQTRGYVRQVGLVIIDEIHLLGGDRGPILEIIVSRMNYIASQSKGAVRLLGMSTACANATDLANWLGVGSGGLFNFRHSVRPVPLEIYIDGFPDQRGFCPLMQSMNRPTFLSIKNHSPDKPVIVFVASRRQTRLTAKDLINFCGMEDNPRRFVRMDEEDLQLNLARAHDESLREALVFGIGLHHAGLVESDRQLAEELFANNKIQILVATSTLAWGINLPAHLVVVKGTQYFDAKIEAYRDMDLTDVLQMLGRAGRPQFDSSGIARIFTQDSRKAFYKHFLHTGFPVESTLHKVLDNHLGAEVAAGTITTNQDALDYLTWTFFFRRLHKNPSYYGLEVSSDEHNTAAAHERASDYLVSLVDSALSRLAASGCVLYDGGVGEVDPTPFGRIASYYYLSHHTIRHMLACARPRPRPAFAEVLAWVSAAAEFDELPVRHNEDLVNVELARHLPLPADNIVKHGTEANEAGNGGNEDGDDNPRDDDTARPLPMWDPHVKTFLLLQAYFSRIDLPIADYVGDQTSVLDQSIRVSQACVDMAAELRQPSTVRRLLSLLQAVKSARWADVEHPLSILPGIATDTDTTLAAAAGIPSTLAALVTAPAAAIARVPEVARMTSVVAGRFFSALARLPAVNVKIDRCTTAGVSLTLSRRPPAVPREYRRPSGKAGEDRGGFPVYAPRYPKPQTEGFIVLVTAARKGKKGEGDEGELLGLKRVSWPLNGGGGGQTYGQATARVSISFPGPDVDDGGVGAGEKGVPVMVRVVSDSYLGLEWTVTC